MKFPFFQSRVRATVAADFESERVQPSYSAWFSVARKAVAKAGLILGLGLGVTGQGFGAVYIEWGALAVGSIKDSKGNTLGAGFTFALGTFWDDIGNVAVDLSATDPREW